MSKLVCIRHGKPKTQGYASNVLYPLSKEGIKKQTLLAQMLKAKGIWPDQMYCSPLLRARESTEVIAQVLPAPFLEEEALGPIFDEEKLLELIPKGDLTIFFIGHAPTLAEFFEALIGEKVLKDGIEISAAAICEFKGEIGYKKAKFCEYIAVS